MEKTLKYQEDKIDTTQSWEKLKSVRREMQGNEVRITIKETKTVNDR